MIYKILYWGMASCGKTTIVDTLYKLTKEQNIDIIPKGNLTKIAREDGATIYFDRGVFQSKKQEEVLYNIHTVAGQISLFPLRKKVFKGSQGVIFVVDSQMHLFEDNIKSLKELIEVAGDRLIKEIPLIIMLNKQDLENVIDEKDFEQVLIDEDLWYNPKDDMYMWNPIIYKTCALYKQQKDVYRSFSECARRTGLYHTYGKGKAPRNKSIIT